MACDRNCANCSCYYGTLQPYADSNAIVYQVTPSGAFTQIATLPFFITAFAGAGTILQGQDGNFYGIQSTGLGCSQGNQHGGVYKLTPAGESTLLHDFGVCEAGVVNSLIEAYWLRRLCVPVWATDLSMVME